MSESLSIRSGTPLTRWLRKHAIGVAGVLMVVGFSIVMWRQMTLCEDLINEGAIHDAAKFNRAVAEFRTVYTSEVVNRAKSVGIKVSHDYTSHAGAIPLPATLSMMLGNRLGEHGDGIQTRLYSDHPFPWSKDGGPRDNFEKDALAALRQNPEQPFFRFEAPGGVPVIRYATADLMRQSCVDCHNTHPNTPKKGWKVGDVRGVLTVTVPMEHAVARTHTSVRSQFYALAACGGLVLCVFAFAVVRMERHSKSIESAYLTLSRKQKELEAEREDADAAREALCLKAEQLEDSRQAALNLMSDMEAARDAANAASLAKSNFLANMSHEIRTPMTAILGFSELLTDPDISREDQQRTVETINRNGRHLLDLINDILDLSKIESGHLKVEQTNCFPVQLAHEVIELLSVRADEKSLDLSVEIDGQIPSEFCSDPFRLRQALVNLAGNAIKFTASGHVRIRLRCEPSSKLFTFDVEDSGIGMTPEQVAQVFKPFCQADASTTRQFGGTGLGLTITKQIAKLLGGELTVTSEPGRGSTFSLTVATGPLENAEFISSLDVRLSMIEPETTDDSDLVVAARGDQRDLTESAAVKRKGVSASSASCDDSASVEATSARGPKAVRPKLSGRILLIEDGPDNQRLVSFLLRKAGAEVDIAENGKFGVERAKESLATDSPYDLILSDMQMPVMDGYTAVRILRESGWDGPIIALTAHALQEEVEKCLAAGCDGYLRKPIEKDAFFTEISRRLEAPPATV